MDLFRAAHESTLKGAPLAARLRPKSLDEVLGQDALTRENGLLRKVVAQKHIPSMIFWGPPGCGKTTLAEILCKSTDARFEKLSAVLSGVKDIRKAIESAERARYEHGKKTLLFVDEIHRFNKSQQDALLPHVEKGIVTLLGATTENPSFEVNAALLSRCRVITVRLLEEEDLRLLTKRALAEGFESAPDINIENDAERLLIESASGDARRLLTSLEVAVDLALYEHEVNDTSEAGVVITLAQIEQACAKRLVRFDKKGDQHYGVISAFIKSMRGSNPDAALHYLTRMLEAGEDPRFILRRILIFASEDIGNADPRALQVAVAAQQAFDVIGLPEGAYAMAQAVTFCACAPKSNASYAAYHAARADLEKHGNAAVPLHLQNAATALMKSKGIGDGYKYPHDFEGSFVAQQYLPDAINDRRYYEPTSNGLEKTIAQRLQHWREQES